MRDPDEDFLFSTESGGKGKVAALRDVMHNRLELKTPDLSFRKTPEPTKPAWAKNVKVYEPNGYLDPHADKHNMGRVLDGPVNPNKFFQGVPPPSYNQVKSSAPPESKPPAPPVKPQSAVQPADFPSFRHSKPSSYRIPYDVSIDPRHLHHPEDVDDSASIISSCISTFGESSEIAGFSAAAEQRHLYEQYKRKLLEENRETPRLQTIQETSWSASDDVLPARSLFSTEPLTPFGQPDTKTPLKTSIDLESSQLLVKPKSPAPYSTASSDHYGTIRRRHKPVSSVDSDEKSNNENEKSLSDSLSQAFEISSSIESTKNAFKNSPKNDRSIFAETLPTSSAPPPEPSDPTPEPEEPSGSSKMMQNPEDDLILKRNPYATPEEDVSQWYRKMFKQMHKKDEVDEKPEQKAEEPKTAAEPASFNWPPLDYGSKPPHHFHLPSYRFRDEDPRPIRCGVKQCSGSSKYGTPCLMCDRPRKDVEFAQVDALYKNMKPRQLSQNSLDLIRITNHLDETTRSLDAFLRELGETWKRSKSQPTMRVTHNQTTAVKTNEEELVRLRAEKLAEELRKENDRKHGFIPSAAPSLQNNMDRLNSLLYEFSSEPAKQQHPAHPAVETATAVYKFEPRSSRELGLNRGDIVRIIREVDAYWMEGERNGRCGIFPTSYVQMDHGVEADAHQKMRAIYPFTARSDTELSLKKGEIVTKRRHIDSNWLEGSNHIGNIGIFPSSYVEPLAEPVAQQQPQVQQIFPLRPKTPKIDDIVPNKVRFEVPSSSEPTPINYYNPPEKEKPRFEPSLNLEPTPMNFYNPPEKEKPRFEAPLNLEPTPVNLNYYNPQEKEKPRFEPPLNLEPMNFYKAPEKEKPRFEKPEEPILEQFRKVNEPPKARPPPQQQQQQKNDFIENAASLIPQGSEMYRALYPYQPQKDDELQLYPNDIIFVVERCDDGWFIGTSLRTGDFGIFPGNYVKRH